MVIGQYATNFDSFSGEKFTIDPEVETRGTDRLVRTTLIQPHEEPIAIAYRLRASGGSWKIVDVFYRNSISQLATRRSDFSRVLATGGAKALIRHLDRACRQGRQLSLGIVFPTIALLGAAPEEPVTVAAPRW